MGWCLARFRRKGSRFTLLVTPSGSYIRSFRVFVYIQYAHTRRGLRAQMTTLSWRMRSSFHVQPLERYRSTSDRTMPRHTAGKRMHQVTWAGIHVEELGPHREGDPSMTWYRMENQRYCDIGSKKNASTVGLFLSTRKTHSV
jgi:hypothetical protein